MEEGPREHPAVKRILKEGSDVMRAGHAGA